MSEELKTGTTTIGIVCKDGLVLAADKRATSGNMIVDKKCKKIHQIADDIIITMAGTVSDAQLLTKLVKAEIKLKEIRTGKNISVKEAANLLAGMVYENIRKFSFIPGISHFLLGGKDTHGFHLYDVYADGSLTLCDDYLSSGSGSVFALGVMETLYKKDISVDEAIKLVVKAVNAALQRDSASGNGINIFTVTSDGVKEFVEKEVSARIEL